MIVETLLSVVAVGSAVIAGTAMMTKERDKIVKPTTYNIDNSIHNNNCNNSYKKTIKTSTVSSATETKIKDSGNMQQTTQQSSEIDHDKIIDELYLRYKLDKNADDLNNLMKELNNL
jgi:hypothetical protein